MGKARLMGVVGTVLALLALAPLAHAIVGPRRVWYQGDTEVKKGEAPKAVKITSGTATIAWLSGGESGTTISCKKVTGKGAIWNPAPTGYGEDSISSLAFTKCTSAAGACRVQASALPWHSVLYSEGPEGSGVEGDDIEAVALEAGCGASLSLVEGPLQATVGDNHLYPQVVLTGSLGQEAHVSLALRLKAKGGVISIKV